MRCAHHLVTQSDALLVVALFWDQGHIPDLSLRVHRAGMAMREHLREGKKKSIVFTTIKSLPPLVSVSWSVNS